jgi:16S rRNA (adenine1518-N6/adenine1519-N6)-dimethyltransferase
MKAKKSLGQNFLMHARIAERIAIASQVTDSDTVLEIGPGTGMLTAPLLRRAKKVIAIEADRELFETLKEKFRAEIKNGSLKLILGDIRTFDPTSIAGPYALVANIPYYLTGEIIRSFLSAEHKPSALTLLLQKEVAVRIARSKKESILSVAVKTYGIPKYLFTVPKGAFMPAPSVDSAVLSISEVHMPFVSHKEEDTFFRILRTGFAHKRKLLAGNLTAIAPREQVLNALKVAKIPEKARAEDVSLASWRALTTELG